MLFRSGGRRHTGGIEVLNEGGVAPGDHVGIGGEALIGDHGVSQVGAAEIGQHPEEHSGAQDADIHQAAILVDQAQQHPEGFGLFGGVKDVIENGHGLGGLAVSEGSHGAGIDQPETGGGAELIIKGFGEGLLGCHAGGAEADRGLMADIHAQDGIGIKTALYAGLGVGIITGRNDPCVLARMSQLGVTEYHAGFEAKLPKLEAICRKYGLKMEEIAYVGDDWIDLDPMRSVGMPIAVANAVAQVKKEARYITAARSGEGAVREALEFLLAARLDGKNPADYWTAATGPARR